ncbi:MAG: DGQHR domain-containing protein [Candidatus Izemoplasmatales bacterium]
MVKKKKTNRKKMTKEQKAENKKRRDFSKKIENIFVFSGFKKIPVRGMTFQLGGRSHELDHCFVYENILIICEDTIQELKKKEKGETYNNNHKLIKNETAEMISDNKKEVFELLKKKFTDCKEIKKYSHTEFKVFYLYFEYGTKKFYKDTVDRFKNLKLIDAPTMNYFVSMSKCIKTSFKYELFRFLKLSKTDVGIPNPTGEIKSIKTPIIYPDSVTGFQRGIRIVSFMMKPGDLIENCCVLRKDGWDKNIDLYQRLVIPSKIKSIRKFVAEKQTAFLNNIIVTLPKEISFYQISSDKEKSIELEDITKYRSDIGIRIPADFNSMIIIDGQHRVFAYYEDNNKEDSLELKIRDLRDKLNLLVTGVIYPDNEYYNDDLNKRKFESDLFVSINENAKVVDADTIIHVQSILNPTSSEAISRKVIELLNEDGPFKSLFELSKVEPSLIKTASIIKYALTNMVAARNNENSLFYYWLKENHQNEIYELRSSKDINDYVKYCATCLNEYFNAIKEKFRNDWNKNSKLLQVVSLNAFIIALRETLKLVGGPKNSKFYSEVIKDLDIDFNDIKNFPYAGSQYKKFANDAIIPLFNKHKN